MIGAATGSAWDAPARVALASGAARRAAYDFFRTLLLRPVTTALLEELRGRCAAQPASIPALVLGAWQGSAAQDADADELRWEFNRLCVGPRHPAAPPYESVYRTPERLLAQRPAALARKAYADLGLRADAAGLPEDHLGLELQYVFVLHVLENEAGDEATRAMCRDMGDAFLAERILPWASSFCSDACANARLPFWRDCFAALAALMRAEARRLGLPHAALRPCASAQPAQTA